MRKTHERAVRAGVALALIAGGIGAGSWAGCARADSGDGNSLAEVIVTAQKREQNLQEVGTSVAAFDTKTLESLGFKDVTDIASQVPGLQFN